MTKLSDLWGYGTIPIQTTAALVFEHSVSSWWFCLGSFGERGILAKGNVSLSVRFESL